MSDYSKLKPENMAIAAVFYNPTAEQIKNLTTFSNFKKLIVVDNSKKSSLSLIKKSITDINLVYIHHTQNLGLSVTYNEALNLAQKAKIDYLMLADQDSVFDIKTINKLSQEAKKLKLNLDEYAIIGFPWYSDLSLAPKDTIIDEQLIVFSSGSVLNVDVISKLGGFDERFFIDSVDAEISLRAIYQGYKTAKILNLGFQHNIGEPKSINSKMFNKDLVLYNHAPTRRYYQVRNSLLIKEMFKDENNPRIQQFVSDIERIWLKDQLKTIFYEKQKLKKVYYSLRGWLDFNLNKFGKI
jgi:rhamnosyltransferase